jgi:hypothetical protein
MEDGVDLADDLVEVASREVDGDELEVVPCGALGEIVELLAPAVVVVEAVDAHDVDAVAEQRLGQVRADEPCAAGDERALHGPAT